MSPCGSITTSDWDANSPPTNCRPKSPHQEPTRPAGSEHGASSAPATNGSPPKIAPATRCPAPIPSSSPATPNGAAGACPAPNTISTRRSVERQARLIAVAPRLAELALGLVEWARKSGEEMPTELADLAHAAQDIVAHVKREAV